MLDLTLDEFDHRLLFVDHFKEFAKPWVIIYHQPIRRYSSHSLPAFALPQCGDMRDVMFAVPGVEIHQKV